MQRFSKTFLFIGFAMAGLMSGCGSSSNNADPNAVVSAVSTAIKAAGNGMTGARRSMHSGANRVTSADCDVHGYPNVTQSDDLYPGHLTYCFMTVDQGDTVLGGFSTPTMVSCILHEANVPYDNAAHTVTITSAILTACHVDDAELTAGTSMTVTTSSPASFNANYANGAVIDLSSSIGLTFKIAFNNTGSKTSFITSEAWTDNSVGTTAGTLDSSTGDLWYEARVERMNCTVSSRCGWSRHTRIHALLTMSGTTPTGLTSLTFGYSNIQTTPGQSSFGGQVITASGDLTSGIKARMWNSTNGSGSNPTAISDYNTVSKWVEDTNAACYTHASDTAGTCGTGLAGMSSTTKFVLNTTDSHTAYDSWLGSITGQTFTSVNMDSDTQF